MRVVLDTNIIVSALLAPRSTPGMVLLLALDGRFEICVSGAVLAEYAEVLHRPRFKKLDPRDVHHALGAIRRVALIAHPSRRLAISGHEADNRFYECAEAAGADYLVTGNTKHFPVGIGKTAVVTAGRLLELIQGEAHEGQAK
jgi:putative PIN family toxin of toxin-antitoxin system